MDTIDVTLKLPEELVDRAKSAGLLTAEQIAELLMAELDRRERIKRLRANIQKLHAVEPPLTQEEVNAEIKAHREEQRRHAG